MYPTAHQGTLLTILKHKAPGCRVQGTFQNRICFDEKSMKNEGRTFISKAIMQMKHPQPVARAAEGRRSARVCVHRRDNYVYTEEITMCTQK
jgi:hypothetical protein